MICKKCGANLAPGVKFCGKCGTPVTMQPPQPTCAPTPAFNIPVRQDPVPQPVAQRDTTGAAVSPRKKKHRVLPAVCVSLIVLIMGAVGVLSWLDIIPVQSMLAGGEKAGAGRNIEWVMDGDTLVISGTGKMWNWTDENPAPWFEIRDSVHHVLIKPGVSNVGAYAFAGFDHLSSVVLPSTIAKIEDSPFSNTEPPENVYYEGSEEDWDEISLPENFPEIKPSCDTIVDDKAAFQVYLNAVETLFASGAWSESMDTDIWLTPVGSNEGKLTASVDYTVQISGYQKDDYSDVTVSGNARISLAGDEASDNVTEFTFDGNSDELRYHYIQPIQSTITSYAPEDSGTIDVFFDTVRQLTQEETTFSLQSGNFVRFGMNADTMKKLIGETVGQLQNVEMIFENCSCTAEAEVAADGKLASLRMDFPLSMTIDGTEFSGDYSVYLWFEEYEETSEPMDNESENDAEEQEPAPTPSAEPQSSDLSTYAGKWEIDFDTTESQTGVSAMTLFGGSYAAGSEMTITSDGEFSYHFPIGGSFVGNCTGGNDVISYSATFEESNMTKTGDLVPEIVNGETYLIMKMSDFSLYWKRVES